MIDIPSEPIEAPVAAASVPESSGQSADSARSAKLVQRRFRWQWNLALASWTLGVGAIVALLAGASYWYHSRTAASSFRTLADAAAADGDYAGQVKWLGRYSLLRPDDRDAIAALAIAADEAADLAPPERRYAAINNARKQLADSIARLGDDDKDLITDLRGRLIERLLQLGSQWLFEAERQVLLLDADADDPAATQWMALTLMRQVNGAIYQDRDQDSIDQDAEHWKWLSNQNPGTVLLRAMDLNPQDPELISLLIQSYNDRIELFKSADDENWETELAERAKRMADTLAKNTDSRSKYMLYQLYLVQGRQADAERLLLAEAEAASERLAQIDLADTDTDANSTGETPDYAWDHGLLFDAAMLSRTSDPSQAQDWLTRLTLLDLKGINSNLVETVFDQAGKMYASAGDVDQAIATWEHGLQRLPNSLQLHFSISSALLQNEPEGAKTRQAMDGLRTAIRFSEEQLSRLNDQQLPLEERATRVSLIDRTKWQLELMESVFDLRAGNEAEALDRLHRALRSVAEVEIENRVWVAKLLADIYSKNGVWDQAAAVLERAIALDPNDNELRVRAAGAWDRAGNRLKANEQWRAAGISASLDDQVAALEATYNYQLRLPPEMRTFVGVRASIAALRKKLSNDASDSTASETDLSERSRSMIHIIDASVPPEGVQPEEYLRSVDFADRLGKLCQQHSSDAMLHAFAAERLAVAGRGQESDDVLHRLEAMTGPDATAVVITKARIEASKGQLIAASQLLSDQADRDQERQVELLELAARFAKGGQDAELAYLTLLKIPEQKRTVSVLYILTQIAGSLAPDAKVLATSTPKQTPAELSLDWESKLRKKEGENGSYWKFLRATRLIDQLRGTGDRIQSDDPKLGELRRLTRGIIEDRPRWGEAISLEGWLLALDAQTRARVDTETVSLRERSIEQLRNGIAAGDRQLRTRVLLFNLLLSLNRTAEAEKELELAASAIDGDIDENSVIKINLASRRGQFDRAVEIAKAEVEQRPDDYRSHVVLAQAATIAAKNAKEEERRLDLIEQASDSIQRASDLTSVDEPTIYLAKLELNLITGNREVIEETVANISKSKLSPYDKAMFRYRAYEQTGQNELALEMLQEAFKYRKSARNLIAQAAINRSLDQLAKVTSNLREALTLDPSNEDLRFDLARSIVVSGTDQIDWEEISRLLSGSQGPTWRGRFQHAALLYQTGGATEKDRAASILRDLYRERGEFGKDAGRWLAYILREQLKNIDSSEPQRRDRIVEEVRSVYVTLTLDNAPAAADFYQYATFLLDEGSEQDHAEIERLRDQLIRTQAGALFGLEVAIRFSEKVEGRESIPSAVETWAAEVRRQGLVENKQIDFLGGVTLSTLGFFDAGIEYLEKAYRESPEPLPQYVATLVLADRLNEALDVCVQHFAEHNDSGSAGILAGLLIKRGDQDLLPEHKDIIRKSVNDHPKDVTLLENVATLRLQQQAFEDAIALYERVLSLDPVRVRSLNNLAMALSEFPSRAVEGIPLIERALKIAGDNAELFDTRGVVLLRAARLDEAAQAFQKAFDLGHDPRFKFHLIVTRMAQNRMDEAKELWKTLDLEKLDPRGLTLSERKQLDSMKADFGS